MSATEETFRYKKKKMLLRSQEISITSYKLPIFLQLSHIGLHLLYFFDVEERRRRRLAIVFPGHGVEYHRKFFRRQIRGFQETVDDGCITAWHEITAIKLLIGELEDGFVGSEVFDEFNHTEKRKKKKDR